MDQAELRDRKQRPPELLFHAVQYEQVKRTREHGLEPGKMTFVYGYPTYYAAVVAAGFEKRHVPVVFKIRARQMALDGYGVTPGASGDWEIASVPPQYIEAVQLQDVVAVEMVRLRMTTRYSKVLSKFYELVPAPMNTSVHINHCFVCGAEDSIYTFRKYSVECLEVKLGAPRKSHLIKGCVIRKEQRQDEAAIMVEAEMEIEMERGKPLVIDDDRVYQNLGLRYKCPACSEENLIAFIGKPGWEETCRKCKTHLLTLDGSTEIIQLP